MQVSLQNCHRATARSRPAAFHGSNTSRPWVSRVTRTAPITTSSADKPTETTDGAAAVSSVNLDKELTKFTRQAAATFAPRSSTVVKNPAYRGSTLYWVFEGQAWFFLVIGGLLSFNVLFPTDAPDIPRLLGMWSVWMLTIPSLRAKECMPKEKEALNILFLLVPLVNITLPFIWKSFAFIFVADVIALGGIYTWKGVWEEVYVPILAGNLPASGLVSVPQAESEDK